MKKYCLSFLFLVCILLLWLTMPVEKENANSPVFSVEKKHNGIVYSYPRTCKTLDPAEAQNNSSALIISNIFEGLVQSCPKTHEIKPCLATSWKVSEDELEWTFNLRHDVKFHNGDTFNAHAVKFSIKRQFNNNVSKTYGNFVYGPVDKIKILDDYTIKFILKYPYTPFLNNLAMPFSAPVVSPDAVEKHGNNFWRHPVGTGPFEMSSWKGKNIVLKSNSSYWGEQPPVSLIKFVPEPNEYARMNMLKNNEAQIITNITPDTAQLLKDSGFKIYKSTGPDISYLGFYTNQSPFSSQNARRAIELAINKEKIVKETLNRQGITANSLLPPFFDITPPPTAKYNVEKAKNILSNIPMKLEKIKIITYQGKRPYNQAGGQVLASAIAEQLKKIGIKTEIKSYPWDKYKNALAQKKGDAFLYGWISDNGDPDNFLYPLLSTAHIKSGLNITCFKNKELSTLLFSAQQAPNGPLRKKLYEKALKIIKTEVPIIPINHSLQINASVPSINNYYLHYTGWDKLKKLDYNQYIP
ncbi:MAG: ABC transporter substrate-binding protein [Clostridiales bacterium]|nr:ABC transporter substrate-binding protein [Clostridiales bacterium]MCF8021409.1 ABC transporter substrate-binding protein [Clostridiales bacterium]